MLYSISLVVALGVFVAGLAYKTAGWFRLSIGRHDPSITPSARRRAALKGVFSVLFSAKIGTLLKVFISDVILQRHILKQDGIRWTMHMLLFAGFTFLFFAHALDRIIITSLAKPYSLTVNPYLLTSGLMVLAGVGLACHRRFVLKVTRLKTNPGDSYALILVSVIILSGIGMELTKLSSYEHYQILWDVHLGACLLGLAYLPFSKMFHLVTTPLSLLANAVMDEHSHPANTMTRQALELDACMHCTNCSNRCSVAAAFDSLGNENILPSERMAFLKDYITGKDLDARGLASIAQGIYLCTNCDRCTVICPAGINLRDLWFNVREEMIQRDYPEPLMLTPFSYYRGLNQGKLEPAVYHTPLSRTWTAVAEPFPSASDASGVVTLSPANQAFKKSSGLSDRAGSFAYCFACENCTTVCPVVENYENPQQEVDLLPHQIMRSLGMGIKDLALGSRMLWDCLTCYQCQEHCPQGVKVTDILFELKNLAASETSGSQGGAGSDEYAVNLG